MRARDLIAVASVAFIAWGCAASQTPVASVETEATEARKLRGYATYQENCGRCHGPVGRGDGPDAGQTRVMTSDLTTIQLRHGGVFPEAKIVEIIDGRREIRAHGPSGMPVWGKKFSPPVSGGPPAEVVVRDQIVLLVEYIRSIQVEPQGESPPPTM